MKLTKRFERSKDFFDEYKSFMKIIIDNNFMEIIPDSEIKTHHVKFWYLTHHAVYHKQKNKIRVVFNCSLKFHGKSLNDVLQRGPDLANSLVWVLLRFRQEYYAVMGDIEKMFYQVKVPKCHSDYLRLFWFDPISNKVVNTD